MNFDHDPLHGRRSLGWEEALSQFDRNVEQSRRTFRVARFVVGLILLVNLTIVAGLVYVALHFLLKVW